MSLRALVLAALSVSALGCAIGRKPIVYSRGIVVVRSSPSLSAPVVRQSLENERMIVDSSKPGWYELKAADQYGDEWVPVGMVNTPQQEQDRRCAGAALRDEGWAWKKRHDDMITEGKVTNISGKLLRDVTVKVSYISAAGVVISSDVALIDYNPILPGESSPYKIVSTWNKAVARGKIRFGFLKGADAASCRRPE